MVNHARTLLLNRSGTDGSDAPGEQYVPGDYRKLELPGFLVAARARLFGVDPDRAMLNYRLAQYLTLVHATELHEYFVQHDPRLTYIGRDSVYTDLFSPARFTPVVSPSATAWIQGSPKAPDPTGRMWHDFTVTIATDADAIVTQHAPFAGTRTVDLGFGSVGTQHGVAPLGDSGYGLMVADGFPGTYRVSFHTRPQWDLGQVVETLNQLGEPVLVALFGGGAGGASPVEPYRTFRNLFFDHAEIAYRLAGFIAAVVFRTEEVRRGG